VLVPEAVGSKVPAATVAAEAPPVYKAGRFSLGLNVGLPIYDKTSGPAGGGYRLGEQTSVDFAINANWYLRPNITLGLIVQPGVLAQAGSGNQDESRFRFSLTPNVRYFFNDWIYMRGGLHVPIAPDPSFGVLYGIGASVGSNTTRALFEFSSPVTFVGDKSTFLFVFSVGLEYRLGPT
jgi:hypothetical protein